MDQAEIEALKSFVEKARHSPSSVWNHPDLSFFQDFLQNELGATKIPAQPSFHPKTASAAEEEQVKAPAEAETSSARDFSPEIEIEHVDTSIEATEEASDRSNELKSQALEALESGNMDLALSLMSEAIKLNPSAMLISRRAELFLKTGKPKAAIKDCTTALSINPDSARAYKIRGRAYFKLECWNETVSDLRLAMRIDYDDATNEQLKEAEKKLHEIQSAEKKRQQEQQERERERERERQEQEQARRDRERQERERREQEHQHQHSHQSHKPDFSSGFPGGMGGGGFPGGMGGGFPGGMGGGGFPGGMGGGFPGGMGGEGFPGAPGGAGFQAALGKLMQDPEVMALLQKPHVMAAVTEIQKNPAAAAKYQNDPDVQRLITKFQNLM